MWTQVLSFDDLLEFSFALGRNVCPPLVIDLAGSRDGIDEVLDEVLFVSQAPAGVDRARNLGTDLLIFAIAVGFAPLLDEHEDVVDVDLDLLDQLDFKVARNPRSARVTWGSGVEPPIGIEPTTYSCTSVRNGLAGFVT